MERMARSVSHCSVIDDLKYVLILLSAEQDLSALTKIVRAN